MNAVISTTFGHNLGDDFIRIGVEKIFREVGPLAPVYYDRCPSHQSRGGDRWQPAIESGWADAVIIAGTPGWTEEAVPLYRLALDRDLPIYMLGIGVHTRANLTNQFEQYPEITRAMEAAKVVVARDNIVRVLSTDVDAVLPCPAMLAPRDDLPKWGILDGTQDIVHSTNELPNNPDAFYSDDPSGPDGMLFEYETALKVWTDRLHGAIAAKGAGVPEIHTGWLPEDERCVETWKVVQEYEGTREDLMDEYTTLLRDIALP